MSFTAKDVQILKDRTGVGMMECKKALADANGNMDKAIELLREKGMATAAKKAGRIASQGIVDSYIHLGGKIGVLLEVNCETDFVAKNEQFTSFVHDIALQIAASKPLYISKDEVPATEVQSERDIFRAQALNEDKPKPLPIIEKMVEGRISKFFKEVCLLEQDFVKDPGKTITELLNDMIARTGEKITIRRFVRFEMGEGLEKKVDNFAEEINAQLEKMKK
ncbi:MAG: translation elongation factor Ts [Firmicutes bacterium]|nr:translation elongation factor Ts [Bacillota bacterium]